MNNISNAAYYDLITTPTSKQHIFLFGDSIMEGYSSDKLYNFYETEQTWCFKLQQYYDTKLKAVSGRKMIDRGVKQEFQQLVHNEPADSVVCFEMGTNDLAFQEPEMVVKNIREFIELVPKTMKPFYMTHCGIRMHRDTEDEFFKMLTQEAIGCPILDMRQYKERLLGRDGLHYTLAAQDLVTDVVHEFVEQLIREK